MHKLMLLFEKPEKVLEFEQECSESFVALAESMPGITRVAVIRIYGSPTEDSSLHMIHEFYFEDSESLRAAMSSAEGRMAGQALMSFASDVVTIVFAEHLEEARPL